MLLQFTVRAQQIFREDRIPLASDSRLYIAATAVFDSEWDDLTARWLTFEPRTGTAITAVLADGNSFDESLGVSLSAGTWRVSAHGSNTAGKEIHTTPVLLNVAQAGGRDGEAPPYVPPDAAGQIAAVAEEARDTANRAMELAEQSGENAEIAKAAAETAVESAKTAVAAATEAQKSAEEAAESAKEAAEGGGVQSDYAQNDPTAKDYIKNRPGGYEEGFEITWDGDTTGRVSMTTLDSGSSSWYKISDKILTVDELIGSTVTVNGQSVEVNTDVIVEASENAIMLGEGALIIVKTAGDVTGDGTLIAPETGVYSVLDHGLFVSSLSNISVYPFPDKYIPDTIARKDEVYTKNEVNKQLGEKAEISLGISDAAVKNLVQVTAIDGKGRPTAWNTVAPDKAVILPSANRYWMLGADDNGDIFGIDITASYVGINETITDSWEEIIAACADGTYSTKYSVGDTKLLNLGSEGFVAMQIAAFDADTLADGGGKAPISWISEQLLKTSHRMNPERVTNSDGTYQEGTGRIGGWEKSEMRSYLINTIKPLIPSSVNNAIKPVTKTQRAYDTSGSSFAQTTTDDIWIPSEKEILGFSSLYYPLFQNTDANRVKKKSGSTSASNWWLRSVHNMGVNDFYHVHISGIVSYQFSYESSGIALGFCT